MTLKNINARITIDSEQRAGGERCSITHTADCAAYDRGGKIVVFYNEGAETLDGAESVLKYDSGVLTLRRRGAYSSEMVFCEGRESSFVYRMPYGAADMRIKTNALHMLRADGGILFRLDYELINAGEKQRNKIKIAVNFV